MAMLSNLAKNLNFSKDLKNSGKILFLTEKLKEDDVEIIKRYWKISKIDRFGIKFKEPVELIGKDFGKNLLNFIYENSVLIIENKICSKCNCYLLVFRNRNECYNYSSCGSYFHHECNSKENVKRFNIKKENNIYFKTNDSYDFFEMLEF